MAVVHAIDLERVLRLRIAVARYGEMDVARWWNTKGQLGSVGRNAVRRGLPRTHSFARARAVIAVAAQRCTDFFDHRAAATLWRLPETLEEELDACWSRAVDRADEWKGLFTQLEEVRPDEGLLELLRKLDVISAPTLEAAKRLKRSAENRAVALPGTFRSEDATIELLAAGFDRGEPGALAVPYVRLEG